MVYWQISEDPSVDERGGGFGLFVSLFFILIATVGSILGVSMSGYRSTLNGVVEIEPLEHSDEKEPTIEEAGNTETVEFSAINFQPVIDNWINSTSGIRSVLIYDLDRDEMVGTYNPDLSYNTASLYKLFVVYEGYRRLQSGEWSADSTVGRSGLSIAKCLDLAIRESNSTCAEAIWAMIGRERLNEIVENDFKITNSDISSLVSTPEDVLKMMKIYYRHSDINNENYLSIMKDSFLNQPTTEYNWRQGLPSGFSKANVYNKVGWDYNPDGKYWNIYHDAAIVEFPDDNRHFAVVVMTSRVPFQRIRQLGSDIEQWFESNKY